MEGRKEMAMSAGRSQTTLLVLAALTLWVAVYVLLNLPILHPPMEHQTERAMRRILTCGAGFGLCLAMAPALARAARRRPPSRITIAVTVSLAAYLVHLAIRLTVFHLIQPLWGAIEPAVVIEAIKGDGWMFPLWSAFCLALFAEATTDKRETAAAETPTGDDPALWCVDGRRRVRVRLLDATLFSAEGDYVRLHTAERRYLVRATLKDILSALPEDRFMRVHRSAVVRLDAVEALERTGSIWRLRLRDGSAALVSRPLGPEVRRRVAGAP